MKLIQKGFYTGTGRGKSLLEEILKSDKKDYAFFISTELTAHDVNNICNHFEIDLKEYTKLKIIDNVVDVPDTIRNIIFSLEGISNEEHINIYIHATYPVDFTEFNELQNVTIYHYYQMNKEGIRNRRITKIENVSVGNEYLMSFSDNNRTPRVGKVNEVNSDNVVLFDGTISFRVSEGDLYTGYVTLDEV